MRSLVRGILISSSLLFFSVCHPGQYHQFNKSEIEDAVLTPLFNENTKSQFYRAGMKFRDYEFGGQLVFRQMKEDVFRIVIMSEIGIKFLDMELTPKKRIVHHVNDQLNRPIVLKVFENDFRLLLMNDIDSYKSSIKKNVDYPIIHKLRKIGKGKRYYFIEEDRAKPGRIEKASKFGNKKVVIDLEDYKEGVPHKINIRHLNIPLSLSLDKVK